MDTVKTVASKESFIASPARLQIAVVCGAIVQRLTDEYELEEG